MTRFLPVLAFFAAACDPAELEAYEQGDLNTIGVTSKTGSKLTVSCWDKYGNPINRNDPVCAGMPTQVAGSAAPNGGHDPYLTFVNGTAQYLARGYNGTAMVGGSTRTSVTTAFTRGDTYGLTLEVFAPATETTRVVTGTSVAGRVVYGYAPATVAMVLSGQFVGNSAADVVLVLDNGANYVVDGRQGEFAGTYELFNGAL